MPDNMFGRRDSSAQAEVAACTATGATNSSPYGYTQAQANEIITKLNLVIAQNAEIRATFIAMGKWKGSA